MNILEQMRIKIFADGADLAGIEEMARDPLIKGFTTNPLLMRKSGIKDYMSFAKEAVQRIGTKPISLEVFADDLEDMQAHAMHIATLGPCVYVKIPIMNTRRQSSMPVIHALSAKGILLNITAVFTLQQIGAVLQHLRPDVPAVISVFAGRIADTGRDPCPILRAAKALVSAHGQVELLWASTREIYNLFQAEATGCDIITVPNALIANFGVLGKDLEEFSLETVTMFYNSAAASGYAIL